MKVSFSKNKKQKISRTVVTLCYILFLQMFCVYKLDVQLASGATKCGLASPTSDLVKARPFDVALKAIAGQYSKCRW